MRDLSGPLSTKDSCAVRTRGPPSRRQSEAQVHCRCVAPRTRQTAWSRVVPRYESLHVPRWIWRPGNSICWTRSRRREYFALGVFEGRRDPRIPLTYSL